MSKRKYVGVPTQEEITQQYNEIVGMTKNIRTLKQAQKFVKNNPDCKFEMIENYNGESISIVKYRYKNILVYVSIADKIVANPYITLYSDDEKQFGDELYFNYDVEIERVSELEPLALAE